MSFFFKTLKMFFMILIPALILLVAAIAIFVNTAPQFGQIPKGEDLERISTSKNFRDGLFHNLEKTGMGSFMEMMSTLPDFIYTKNGSPNSPLPVAFENDSKQASDSLSYITWYGHSAFLIEIDGKRILIDPMLGDYPSPLNFGASRYPYQKPIPIEDLKDIDAVIISHDHYDHLDYPSIKKLAAHVDQFFVPLGVGSHLKSWGIDSNRITEMDWWDTQDFKELELVACPSRHFSGRGLADRYTTLWAAWIIKGERHNIFFSGDGGYGEHFREIGEKYGPFDFAMMECGQYNEAWHQIHMMPEESVKAGLDVKASVLMPIHWGAFKLAVHSWTDPIERFSAESKKLNVPIVHPVIGHRFALGQEFPRENWWENL